MPELPEVEVILNQLRDNILGSRIKEFRIGRDDIVRFGLSSSPWFVGSQITTINRHGKSIVLACTKESTTRYCVAELGMTGLFLFEPRTRGTLKHLHITFMLEQSKRPTLHYWNPRRFGRVYLFNMAQLNQFLQRRFGIDPFVVTQEDFFLMIGRSRGRLKALLLNQHNIAGIGNIYANEILHQAGVHPHARGNQLSKVTLARLYSAIRTVLRKAIACGGSTIRDFRAPDGSPGRFQDHHTVYQKVGHPCLRGCQATIRRLMTERSSFYCQHCQKRT